MNYYFRIQDNRFDLPEESSSWWDGAEEDETMGGVSVFANLSCALDDLLGRKGDNFGVNYAEAVEHEGGVPILSCFQADYIADSAGCEVVVDPDLTTERRFQTAQLWRVVKHTLTILRVPKAEVDQIDETPPMWNALVEELRAGDIWPDLPDDVYAFLDRVEKQLVGG